MKLPRNKSVDLVQGPVILLESWGQLAEQEMGTPHKRAVGDETAGSTVHPQLADQADG